MSAAAPPARHWAEIGESTFAAGILILFWVHRVLGRRPFRVCLWPVVAIHWFTRPELRTASLDYLERIETATGALGHAPTMADGLRHVMNFADTMLDKLLAVSGRHHPDRVRADGGDELHGAAAGRRGAVIVTAHMGCLELCRALATARGPIKLNVLVHTRHAEQFNRVLKRFNPEVDLDFIEVTEITPATAVMLDGKIAAGEYVVIAGDRVPIASRQTVTVQFLGAPAPFPSGPYVLASLFKCPLWLMTCVHEGDRYHARFECLAKSVDLPRSRRHEAIAGYAQRYADALARVLARSPFDWFNFYLFWNQTHVLPKPRD